MNPRNLYIGAFVIAVGIITFQEYQACHDLPWPPRLVATGIVFTMLYLFGTIQPELAGVVAIGIILAMIVNTAQAKVTHESGTQVKGVAVFGTVNCTHSESTAASNDAFLLGPGSIQGTPT